MVQTSPKLQVPKDVLKAQNQMEAFKLCLHDVKSTDNPNPHLKFWKMNDWKVQSQATDQSL